MTDVGSVLTPEQMLANAAAAVKSGNTSKNQSAVQKSDTQDTVVLSPVEKVLQKQADDAKKVESYFDSDAYLEQKVSQLRGQLAIYTTLPGLDPSGSVVNGIGAEIKDLLSKQQDKLAASNQKAADAQAKLDEENKQKALDAEITSSDDMLAKVQGKLKPAPLSQEVQALLDTVKGSNVNTTA